MASCADSSALSAPGDWGLKCPPTAIMEGVWEGYWLDGCPGGTEAVCLGPWAPARHTSISARVKTLLPNVFGGAVPEGTTESGYSAAALVAPRVADAKSQPVRPS